MPKADRASGAGPSALALGPGYNNNLNQSWVSRTCLLAAPNGGCLLERTIPAPLRRWASISKAAPDCGGR